MNIKYSREQFDEYTHRFMVTMQVDNDWRNNSTITIYSNDGDKEKITEFINLKKSEKVVGFEIIHVATKEQDDMNSELIEEFFQQLNNKQ